jgi:hypothetical protein
MANPGLPPVPYPIPEFTQEWALKISTMLNATIAKVNNAAQITLANGAASTAMSDARLSAFSVLNFMAMTSSAAAIQATIWVDSRGKGNCTIHHANTANTDQTFGVGIQG